MNSELLARAKKIKLLAMDVDGVLTGGEIIILNSGEEIKIWSVKDRMGFAMLKRSRLPIRLAWLTARQSRQVKIRAQDIGVHFLFQRCVDKWRTLRRLAQRLRIANVEIAYIGDDYVDLGPMKNAGLAICPPQSPTLLKKICHYQTKTPAGKGVAREVIEILLAAQGRWQKAVSHFGLYGFLVLFSLALGACYPKQKTPSESAEKPDQWVEQFKITETLSGIPVWVLNSESAEVFEKQKKVLLTNIRIDFMNPVTSKKNRSKESLERAKKLATLAARLSAPKGEVKMDSRDLSAWGGVEVEAQDGTKLYCDRLTYSKDRQKILSESPVKIVRKNSILLGEGLEASPDLATVKIFRHQASIYPKNFPKR